MKSIACFLFFFLMVNYALSANVQQDRKIAESDSFITLEKVKIHAFLYGLHYLFSKSPDDMEQYLTIKCRINDRIISFEELKNRLLRYNTSTIELQKWLKISKGPFIFGSTFVALAIATPIIIPLIWIKAGSIGTPILEIIGIVSLSCAVIGIPPMVISVIKMKNHLKKAVKLYNQEVIKKQIN